MSLLTICQQAADAIGIQRPPTIIGNTNADARALLAFAQEELESLRTFDWPVLIRQGYVEVALQTWQNEFNHLRLPEDWDRFVPNTMWDRDQRREIDFPTTSTNWAYWDGMHLNFNGLERKARLSVGWYYYGAPPDNYKFGLALEFLDPFVEADQGQQFHFEYITRNTIQGNVDLIPEWSADSNTALLPEHIIKLGVIWRYKASKALPYAKDEQKYRFEMEKAKSSSRSSKTMNMAPCRYGWPPTAMAPDQNYG